LFRRDLSSVPRLTSLASFGGPTATLALLTGSPALGAGDPALAGSTDQRGAVRQLPVSIGAFEVNVPGPASATTVSGSATTSMYGQSVTFTATVTSGGSPVTAGSVAFVDGAATLAVLPVNASGQAAYTTTGLGVAGSPHTIRAVYFGLVYQGSSGTAPLTVTPAPLTVTADNQTRPYGSANPTLTASYSGLVNRDGPAVVSGLTLSTTATIGSGVGSYVITASGGTAANYTITTANGTLTVTPAAAVSPALSVPTTVPAGQGVNVTVVAADPCGNVDPTYTGTVSLTSSDSQAPNPGSYTFTSSDAGVYTFSGLQLFTASPQSISANDGSLAG
jgi:hypothetical protein